MGFNTSYIVNTDLPTALQKSVVTETTLHTNTITVGNGVVANIRGMSAAIIHIRGTFVARMHFEARVNSSVTWEKISVTNLNTGIPTDGVRGTGLFAVDATGLQEIRLVIDEVFSGAISASIHVSPQSRPQPKETTVQFEHTFSPDFQVFGASAYWKQTKPFLNIQAYKAQGLLYVLLQEEKTLGGTPTTIEKMFLNGDVVKIPAKVGSFYRIQVRPLYHKTVNVSLEPVTVTAWGSEQ